MKKVIKFVKDNEEEIIELNPLDNSIVTKDGVIIEWQVDPNIEFSNKILEEIDETKIKFKSSFDVNSSSKLFKENDIEFTIEIDGKAKSFYSPIGNEGFVASASFRVKY